MSARSISINRMGPNHRAAGITKGLLYPLDALELTLPLSFDGADFLLLAFLGASLSCIPSQPTAASAGRSQARSKSRASVDEVESMLDVQLGLGY